MGAGHLARGQRPRIVTALDPETQAVLLRNPWNNEFAGRVAFLDLGGRQTAWTADRTEFLGRNGAPDRPAGLERGYRMQGAAGAGLDPCAALQTGFELAAGARTRVLVLLGEADSETAAADLIRRVRAADLTATLRAVTSYWDDAQGTVQVRTPDRSMDIMLNRWLIYQTLACRLWARSGLYQAGGAYGFRDQLQDVIALVTSRRELAREHLLRAAAHQFTEGDVQHWWHPPSGRGVRTRISDDRLWLPYAVARYLEVTGDTAVLDESVAYIEGPGLRPGPGGRLLPAGALVGVGLAVRPLHRGDRPESRGRGARAAAHRIGRLERRDEPRRPGRPRRERLAGMVPAHRPGRLRADRGRPR